MNTTPSPAVKKTPHPQPLRQRLRRPLLCAVTAMTALTGLAVPLLPGTAHAEGGYRQTRRCLSEGPSPATVTRGVSWAQQQLRYSELWTLATGKGVTVAVIDTGINPGPAFGNRLVGGGDLIIPGERGLRDCDGHGTLVAGIIGGSVDLETGFAGVAPEATILSIRQASLSYAPVQQTGRQTAGTTQSLGTAIDMAVAQGAKVINISEAECGIAGTVSDPKLTASVQAALAKDVVIVAAAGNLSGGPCQTQNTPGKIPVTSATPAEIPGVIAVGAVDPKGIAAPFSLAGPWVGIAAPGVNIISTNPFPGGARQVDAMLSSNGPQQIQGTSFSAPYVAGVAALIRERHPHLTARQVADRILDSAVGGSNHAVGRGIIDPRGALTAVRPQEGEAGKRISKAATTMPAMPPSKAAPPGRAPALWSAAAIVSLLTVWVISIAVRRRRSTD